jgi:hypothetical protein
MCLIDLTNPGAGSDFKYTPADNLSLVLTLEPVIGTNLVVNGDAETAPGKDGVVGPQLPVPGWNATNSDSAGIETDRYDHLEVPYDPPAGAPGHLFMNVGEMSTEVTSQAN